MVGMTKANRTNTPNNNNNNTNTNNADVLRTMAAAMGVSGVGLGAFGAHALKEILTKHGTVAMWQTGTLYQLFHATAVLSLATAVTSSSSSSRDDHKQLQQHQRLFLAGKLMTLGNLLFSGSIYCLS